MKYKILIGILIYLSLSNIAWSQTDSAGTIQQLIDASSSIIDTVDLGHYAVHGLQYFGSNGGIAPQNTIDQALITQLQMTNYNNALSAVQNAVYYNTQALLQDAHENEMTQLSDAVDDFVAATTSMITVVNIFEMASEADTVQEQQQMQDYIEDNNVMLTQTQVDNYNTSLEDVSNHAINAAAYLAASNDESILSYNDARASEYNVNISSLTASYNAVQESLHFYYADGSQFTGYYGFFTGAFKTIEDIYNTGQSIYEGNSL